jgi:adenine-specific DNA glycosylase
MKPETRSFGKFHALIVCHCQNLCHKKKPDCKDCPLFSHCSYGQKHETDPKMALIQSAIAPTSHKKKGSGDNSII